jgi:hypothetical protein
MGDGGRDAGGVQAVGTQEVVAPPLAEEAVG